VEGCKYDFSVVAAILTQKFGFHCPTYRQQDWFAQCGWSPSRSTINDLINVSVDVLTPLFDQMWHLLLQQPIILTDDTRVRLLTRGALSREQLESLEERNRSGAPPGGEPPELNDRGSVTSYAWLYTGLDGLAPYNIFHWSLTHQHAVVDAHLAPFQGLIVGDGFSGYTQVEERSGGRIVHAGCNSHYPEFGFIRSVFSNHDSARVSVQRRVKIAPDNGEPDGALRSLGYYAKESTHKCASRHSRESRHTAMAGKRLGREVHRDLHHLGPEVSCSRSQ
jgi:hypothetical protein